MAIISLWIILSNPSVIREKVKQLALHSSEVSYPENYEKLVLLDKKNGKDFLIGKAISAKVVNERFPFSSRNLDSFFTTIRIIKLLVIPSLIWMVKLKIILIAH